MFNKWVNICIEGMKYYWLIFIEVFPTRLFALWIVVKTDKPRWEIKQFGDASSVEKREHFKIGLSKVKSTPEKEMRIDCIDCFSNFF